MLSTFGGYQKHQWKIIETHVMALHKDFPRDPSADIKALANRYKIFEPSALWFPACGETAEKLVYICKRNINESINLVYIHGKNL